MNMGLSSADGVQEPNCPKSGGSSGEGWGCMGHGGQERPRGSNARDSLEEGWGESGQIIQR